MIDEIPMGGANAVPDMTPFFQRAKEKKPDVFFVFVPSGDHATAVMRTYGALGMKEAGIKLIGPGDITQDNKLQAMGNAAVGLVTMHHYNADLDNAENKRFVASWKKDYGAELGARLHRHRRLRRHGRHRRTPSHAQKGKVTLGRLDGRAQEFKSDQPARHRSSIDPETRDVVMNEYLSEVAVRERPAGAEDDRPDRQRQGPLQGAEGRPLREHPEVSISGRRCRFDDGGRAAPASAAAPSVDAASIRCPRCTSFLAMLSKFIGVVAT